MFKLSVNSLAKFLVILLAPLFLFTSCDEEDTPDPQNIVEVASADAQFSSLVAALDRAGLVSTLEGTGPYTVFAPTNAAFDAFLSANGFANLEAVPVPLLTQVLLNHVVGGTVRAANLTTGYVPTSATESTTSNPLSLYVDLTSGVMLNGTVTVSTADVEATNGVIHVVNGVIGLPTVVTHALSNPDFSILVAALTRADLTADFVGILSGDGPFTVFAPTNAAFQALLDSNPDWNSLDDIPVATLEAVLSYHVVNGANVLSSTLSDEQVVETFLSGSSFTVDITDGNVSIKDASGGTAGIAATDVQGSNGVVHVLNAVLLP